MVIWGLQGIGWVMAFVKGGRPLPPWILPTPGRARLLAVGCGGRVEGCETAICTLGFWVSRRLGR